ncbi:WecB/TagA/CpsF family glycosyltransferase [Thioalkalivibrio sp. XN8]|uniref:WecB/TagA/CpsF family glycosyltransferase n=1 Tax=Thioalkalivibrio sp. XN8 TaxID=2712863 RepID=UPI0013EB9557|nr:WecB/TagA/CpsF family glycosyltransferase [Thioalkalivibrio sp. XN8]NGP53716.1 WecB/TagA/CpsF family glycosyltransferase [Thioalkalivibrio sp. XN8]
MTRPTPPPVYWLLGLPFDAVDLDGAARLIRDHARTGSRLVFATPNLNFLRSSRERPAFRDDVLRTDLSLVDGMPLVWLGRLAGIRFTERVAGSSLVERLVEPTEPAERIPTFFFGAEDDAAERALARVNDPPSGLRGVGALNPGHGSVETLSAPGVIEAINRSGAVFLVVSLGAVKGHAWIEHNRDRLRPAVISHLGAVVNFLAGTVRRAPALLQKLGLEWAWRMAQEPRLFSRYFGDGLFLLRLLVSAAVPIWLQERRLAAPGLEIPPSTSCGKYWVFRPRGSITANNLDLLASVLEKAQGDETTGVELDMRGVDYLDARALGYLYALRHRPGAPCRPRVTGINPRLARLVRRQHAECLWDDPTQLS